MAVAVGKSTLVTDGLIVHLDPSFARNYTQLTEVEVLVVAGGGGGGHQHGGGGGGAGGVIYRSNYPVTPGSSISLSVGAGGAAGSGGSGFPTNGQNSTFGNLTAIGGGYGGSESGQQSGNSGGSGGGGSGFSVPTSGGSGTAGQGFRGGDGASRADAGSVYGSGGGGGGAGGPGSRGGEGNEALGTAGDGGRGLLFNISGYPRYYGGGGGGGYWGSNFAGVGRGGIGGGGDGAGGTTTIYPARPGKPNTGGGGGGSKGDGSTARDGAAGGSGIVIVRYPGPQRAVGGTVTQSGGYIIHSFTSTGSDTFTPSSTLPSNGGSINGLFNFSGDPQNTPYQSGGVTYNTNNSGTLNFDGSNDCLVIPNGMNALIGTNQVTFSAWVFRTSTPNYWAGIISNKVNTTDGICMLITPSGGAPSNTVFFQYDGGTTGTYAINGGQVLATNTWYNIVGVYDNVGLKTYVNGVLNDSANDPGKSISFSAVQNMDIVIGAQSVGSAHFPGRMGVIQIYNRALSVSEILQNFNLYRGRYGV